MDSFASAATRGATVTITDFNMESGTLFIIIFPHGILMAVFGNSLLIVDVKPIKFVFDHVVIFKYFSIFVFKY